MYAFEPRPKRARPESFTNPSFVEMIADFPWISEIELTNFCINTTSAPALPQVQDHMPFLANLQATTQTVQDQLTQIRQVQSNTPVPIQATQFQQLHEHHQALINTCNEITNSLKNLYEFNILSPKEIYVHDCIENEVKLLLRRIQLYQAELQYYNSNYPELQPKCFCMLNIIDQPFPYPLKSNKNSKERETDHPITVELHCAPKSLTCTAVSKVLARAISEDFSRPQVIYNKEQDMENDKARFDLSFPAGTRQKIIRLNFEVKVSFVQPNGTMGESLIESEWSENTIIMTHENQWKSSEGLLFKRLLFTDKEASISWFKFVNTLQKRYLVSTRQSLEKPERPFSLREIAYLSQLKYFAGDSNVRLKDVADFWEWFGDAMHKIRHHKIFGPLWLEGKVFGFVGKEEVGRLMCRKPVGTSLIRFSEQKAGSISLAYSELDTTNGNVSVRHYIVPTKEIDRLGDFINDKVNFQLFIQSRTDFASTSNEWDLPPIPKSQFVAKYCTKQEQPPEGYVANLQQAYFVRDGVL